MGCEAIAEGRLGLAALAPVAMAAHPACPLQPAPQDPLAGRFPLRPQRPRAGTALGHRHGGYQAQVLQADVADKLLQAPAEEACREVQAEKVDPVLQDPPEHEQVISAVVQPSLIGHRTSVSIVDSLKGLLPPDIFVDNRLSNVSAVVQKEKR